jgi:D-arabinose 1-dehydrogenase-like Zn-dependent alcohol dehydrogenase
MRYSWIPLINPNGTIFTLTVGFAPTPIPLFPILIRGLTIQGSAGATRVNIDRMLQFAARHGIKPMIMEFPLSAEGVKAGMKTLEEGKMRYRGVLVAE